MALGSDPYEVLGVPRDASAGQIARARRRLSREYHPDVNPAPDAAARFDEVQQAYHRLSGARPSDTRARDEQGRTRVMRDPDGGDSSVTEAAPGIFIQPASVDFGRLTPERPYADAKVTVAWTGAPPGRLDSTQGSQWWANLGSERPATSCVVFYLRAHAHAGTRNGRQHAQFTVILDDTVLTVPLAAKIQGEFPPGSLPDFTPRAQAVPEMGAPAVREHLKIWLMAIILALVFLVYLVVTTR
jgi:hypothetical protein